MSPYITPGGTLVIPFDCDSRFRWWAPGGQAIAATLAEIGASEAVRRAYDQNRDREPSIFDEEAHP